MYEVFEQSPGAGGKRWFLTPFSITSRLQLSGQEISTAVLFIVGQKCWELCGTLPKETARMKKDQPDSKRGSFCLSTYCLLISQKKKSKYCNTIQKLSWVTAKYWVLSTKLADRASYMLILVLTLITFCSLVNFLSFCLICQIRIILTDYTYAELKNGIISKYGVSVYLNIGGAEAF